ncbi:MAG: c-type cytochrome [Legionella sp.]|nr:c-type cytochrome [Legionella sp.]
MAWIQATEFKKNLVLLLLFITACTYITPVHADKPELIDGYYVKYPPTTPAEGDKAEQIKRGEYLAKMGDCLACHTDAANGGQTFAGGLSIATPFGTFYSPNITPDVETGIGSWTQEDFIRALKEGRNPKGQNYFPVFPYVYFANISDKDAGDLYTYFMSIPAVERKNTPLPFPFNVPGSRLSLWGWKMLFFYPEERLKEDPKQSDEWNRGRYIVDGPGHCSMCHTPLNPLGAPKKQYYLTGGFIDGYWAPNITKLGIETATNQELIDVFVKNELINHAGPVAGPMAEVNHNSLRYLTREDHLAIATYLRTVTSEEPLGLAPSNEPPSLERGREVYLKACTICHQNGEMTAPRIGKGANWAMRLKDGGLTTLYKNAINGYNSMPPKGACVTCSDNDIMSAVDYILNESLSRSQWLDAKASQLEATPLTGKALYETNCSQCHAKDNSGAPKLDDSQAWKNISAKNLDVIVQDTMNGERHPKNGACTTCSTHDIIEAVKYMLGEAQAEGNYKLW